MRKLDSVISASAEDRRHRWRSAMLKVWQAGDVLVGVTASLDISLLTVRDATTIGDPRALADALNSAEAFAWSTAFSTAHKARLA